MVFSTKAPSSPASRTSAKPSRRSSPPRPDAIQLTVGQAPQLQRIAQRPKPALVLRTDVANVYGTQLPRTLFSRMIEEPVLQAVRLDAACVVVNLFRIPDEPEVTEQCIRNILLLKPQCDHYNMPLMIEPLVFQPNAKAGGYMVDGDAAKIIPLVRQAVELGADIIKADPTDDIDDLPQGHRDRRRASPCWCAAAARRPRRRSSRAPQALLEQGASGIVYGRNIIQHPKPRRDHPRAHGRGARRRLGGGSDEVPEVIP
jgi:class I fructose-bisphosphate aldolase